MSEGETIQLMIALSQVVLMAEQGMYFILFAVFRVPALGVVKLD